MYRIAIISRLFTYALTVDDLTKENVRIKQVLKEIVIRKALLVQSSRELLTITAWVTHKNERKLQIPKRERSEWEKKLTDVEGTSEKL